MPKKSIIKQNPDFAVIKTGGKQYLVRADEVVLVDRIKKGEPARKGEKVSFETLLTSKKAGLKIGQPIIKTGTVKAEVIEEIKDKKVIIFKYKPKKRYRKKTGFRAKKTKVLILSF